MNFKKTSNSYYKGPVSDHFDGERFHNPWAKMGKKRWRDFLHWRLGHERAYWPMDVLNEIRPDILHTARIEIRATYIGHATILIQCDGFNILTDPVFADRASPFSRIGPKRVRAPFVKLEGLPKIDAVFISHNHYDHMDLASLKWLAQNHAPVFITPLGNDRHLAPVVKGCKVVTLDWHESHRFDNDMTLSLTPSQHWSRRTLGDINRDLWGGCHLKTSSGKSLYFTGDSGFHEGLFQEIFAAYGPPDIALIPIGAYEPRWFMNYAHMNPEEAVKVHTILNARQSMGFHFETFQLTNEGFTAPREELAKYMTAQGVTPGAFMAPYPGDYVEI